MSFNLRRAASSALAGYLVIAVLLVACGDSEQEPAETAEKKPVSISAPSLVTMRLVQFRPASLQVAAGTKITFTQTDPGFHTVTSGTVEQGTSGVTPRPDGRFDSDKLATDESFSFTFDEPGTYPYFCSNHPATMRGEVRARG